MADSSVHDEGSSESVGAQKMEEEKPVNLNVTTTDNKEHKPDVKDNKMPDTASTSTNAERTVGKWSSIKEFSKSGFREIVNATKAVNEYPHGSVRDMYCSFPVFGRIVDEQSNRILQLMSTIMKLQNTRGNIQFRELDDEKFELLLDFNDHVFERLQENLDILEGNKKQPKIITTIEDNQNNKSNDTGAGSSNNCGPSTSAQQTGAANPKNWGVSKANKGRARSMFYKHLLHSRNMRKPQLDFKVPVDNSADTPFIPRIKEKPNSLKPLDILPEYNDKREVISFLHPYEFELQKFTPPDELLQRKEVQSMPKPIENTPYLYVNTKEQLELAVNELRNVKELAIDVEHHSQRTFLGLTCIVQMSSRTKDYIFDAIVLRDEMHLLNEILTNPRIVKILHGADSDILWLQRDLSLYIVNMFDTHLGAKALAFTRFSLAFLLQHYCDKTVDKTFQLADWRLRPLCNEFVAYARLDTHYLIYIYERITNDIIDLDDGRTDLVRTVFQKSKEICLKRYEKPAPGRNSWKELQRKSKKAFNQQQLYALRGLCIWRDETARNEDESYSYVLPDHMLLQVASNLPREAEGVLACCNPVPPLIRQKLHMVHQIILKARQQPLEEIIVGKINSSQMKQTQHSKTGQQQSSTTPTSSSTTESTTQKLEQSKQRELLSPSQQRLALLIQQKLKMKQHLNTNKDYYNKLYCPHNFSHQRECSKSSSAPENTAINEVNSTNNTPTATTSTTTSTPQNSHSRKRRGYFKKESSIRYFSDAVHNVTEEEEAELTRYMKRNLEELQLPYIRYLNALVKKADDENERELQIQSNDGQLEKNSIDCNNKLDGGDDDKGTTDTNENQLKRKHSEDVIKDKPSNKPINVNNESTDTTISNRKRKLLEDNNESTSSSSTKPMKIMDDDIASQNFLSLNVEADKIQKKTQAKFAETNKQFRLTPTDGNRQNYNKQIDPSAYTSGQRYKWTRRDNNTSRGKSFQSSNRPVPEINTNFNYSHVDYNRFKGGATRGAHTAAMAVNNTWHRRGNSNSKAADKKLNKFFTYNKVNHHRR